MRMTPLLVGFGLMCGTAAVSSQAIGQGAVTVDVTRIGAAKAIENEVEGRLGGAVKKLSVGSEVFQNQFVRTGKASTAQLQFLDETNLSLSQLTQIRLDSFVYDPAKKTGRVAVNVPRGLIRFVTGSLDKRSYTIRTPFVAVGVRGTIFDMLVRFDRVTVLLVDGSVELTVRPRGFYVLDRPNTAITIWRDGRVIGPRDWTGSVTDFAALTPQPAQRKARSLPPVQEGAVQSATRTGNAPRVRNPASGPTTTGRPATFTKAGNVLDRHGLGPNFASPDVTTSPRATRRAGGGAGGTTKIWAPAGASTGGTRTWAPAGAKQ